MRKFLDFIRIGISASIVSLAVSGYLIFNQSNGDILFVMLSAFFLSAGAYGYNSITDRGEDTLNRRKNSIAGSRAGYAIAFFCFAFGLFFSLFLGQFSIYVSAAIIITAIAYSSFGIKRYPVAKNIYTALSLSQSFILGAKIMSYEVLRYYLAVSLFFFIGSIISDIRDYHGDKKSGIRTIPVILGIGKAKNVVQALLALSMAIFLAVDGYMLLPFLVSVPAIYFLVSKDKPHIAHFAGGVSVIFLMVWFTLLKIEAII